MDTFTLNATFEEMFDREALSAAATRLGAQVRERKVLAFDFVLALLSGGCVGPERSIAAVRRSWEMSLVNWVRRLTAISSLANKSFHVSARSSKSSPVFGTGMRCLRS